MARRPTTLGFSAAVTALVMLWGAGVLQARLSGPSIRLPIPARDPGLRGGIPGAGDYLPGLTGGQHAYFDEGRIAFGEVDGAAQGLGPRFNADGCGTCHAHPALGGSSPILNPQVNFANSANRLPSFITADGPVREARVVTNPDGTPDGGVHALFVITGRPDLAGTPAEHCDAVQEDYEAYVRRRNIIFRIPTPTFGLGLIEAIPDVAIRDNLAASNARGQSFGIQGHVNRVRISGDANHSGNDGTIARFGWKAQNKSLLIFAGEAYNVEVGISNELFLNERDENPKCQGKSVPNDTTNTDGAVPAGSLSDAEKFAFFSRFLAAPEPVVISFMTSTGVSVSAASIASGRSLFSSTGCALCHTPTLRTGAYMSVQAMQNQNVNLYSDLAVHGMGPGLADGVSQGEAAGDEFRTAPLWGAGQRTFFLHDGRTNDLLQAIQQHQSDGNRQYRASEANGVIRNFNALSEAQKQDLLNFLRSL